MFGSWIFQRIILIVSILTLVLTLTRLMTRNNKQKHHKANILIVLLPEMVILIYNPVKNRAALIAISDLHSFQFYLFLHSFQFNLFLCIFQD